MEAEVELEDRVVGLQFLCAMQCYDATYRDLVRDWPYHRPRHCVRVVEHLVQLLIEVLPDADEEPDAPGVTEERNQEFWPRQHLRAARRDGYRSGVGIDEDGQ